MDKTSRRFGWLITGAPQGFGRALAAVILAGLGPAEGES
jgi:hypothetical protein